MNNNSSSTSSGISFPGMLAVLFIGLKLTGYINWPWVWVLSPIWIPLVIFLLFLLIIAAFVLIANFAGKK